MRNPRISNLFQAATALLAISSLQFASATGNDAEAGSKGGRGEGKGGSGCSAKPAQPRVTCGKPCGIEYSNGGHHGKGPGGHGDSGSSSSSASDSGGWSGTWSSLASDVASATSSYGELAEPEPSRRCTIIDILKSFVPESGASSLVSSLSTALADETTATASSTTSSPGSDSSADSSTVSSSTQTADASVATSTASTDTEDTSSEEWKSTKIVLCTGSESHEVEVATIATEADISAADGTFEIPQAPYVSTYAQIYFVS